MTMILSLLILGELNTIFALFLYSGQGLSHYIRIMLRMNSFHAVTASHLDCADLLPKSKTTRLLGMKQDMKKTQETSQCRGGSVLWTRKVTQSGNC